MKLKAYAKINLGLKVKGKDEKGYHLLDMVMLPISLCDNIEITKRDDEEVNVIVTNNVYLPQDNSITKSIRLMQEKYNFTTGFDVKIEKNIPTQAGMGGGTSDAAEIIKAVNVLMNINAPLKDLESLAMQVGSDVVYSLYSTLSRIQGTGEIYTKIDKEFKYPILIVKPKSGIKTKDCFSLYNKDEDNIREDTIDKLINSLDKELYIVRKYAKNSLLRPASKIAPIIKKIIKTLLEHNLDLIQMSGSGSTVYAIDKDINKLKEVYELIKDEYQFVGIYETK
jgi:4-diphosphocytidyl-2-C-methyl-D-erythritol kinase